MTAWSRGAYVGRFQPFHNGHLKCIEYILSRVNELIIILGSAQYSHTLKNPFTAGERIEMIRLALREAGISCEKYIIVPVPDTNGVHAEWVSRVLSYTPKFEVVFSNDPLTRRLFIEAGFEVKGIPYFNRETFSATEVRRRIIAGENWEKLVPPSVASYIKSIGGVERLKTLSLKDRVKA